MSLASTCLTSKGFGGGAGYPPGGYGGAGGYQQGGGGQW